MAVGSLEVEGAGTCYFLKVYMLVNTRVWTLVVFVFDFSGAGSAMLHIFSSE